MLNTNGKRLATDDAFLAQLAEIRPTIYFQFDGFECETYRVIRAAPDILPEKEKAPPMPPGGGMRGMDY